MSAFDNLSSDDIFYMCQGMETQELDTLMRTSSRFRQICQTIMNSRKADFQSNQEYRNDIKSIENSLNTGKEVRVSKKFKGRNGNKYRVILEAVPAGESLILKQNIYGPRESLDEVKWILSDVKYTPAFDGSRSAIIDKSKVPNLAESIVNQNYERIYY